MPGSECFSHIGITLQRNREGSVCVFDLRAERKSEGAHTSLCQSEKESRNQSDGVVWILHSSATTAANQ